MKPLFLDNCFLYVDWILNRDLDWNIYWDLYDFLDYSIDVDRFLYVDWLFHDSWYRDLDSSNHLSNHFSWNIYRDFFLHLYVLRDLDNLLYDSFRPRDKLWNLHDHLHRLLYDNFFNDLFRNSSV